MPPDSNGSGAWPADPDQPTHAPPRPATNGSSAVTRPPGLRCQPMFPSASVTWSTGSRLATTTTGLSARSSPSRSSAIPEPTLSTPEPSGPRGSLRSGEGGPGGPPQSRGSQPGDQRHGDVGDGVEPRAGLQQPQRLVAERAVRGE